jgi:hypothetical protein
MCKYAHTNIFDSSERFLIKTLSLSQAFTKQGDVMMAYSGWLNSVERTVRNIGGHAACTEIFTDCSSYLFERTT